MNPTFTLGGGLNQKIAAMIGKKYNFCLVGAGRMGARWAEIISESRDARLALVVDKDKEAARVLAQKHGADWTDGARGLESKAVDAVLIAVPHKFLFFYARLALLAGKHVLVEKPGSRTAAEMAELIRLARRHRRALMVGFNYRFFDAVSRAKKLASAGKFGKINFIRMRHGHAGRPGYGREWRMNKNLAGGGVLMDQGVHLIDLAHWFLPGGFKTVSAATSANFWKTAVEDNAFVLLKNQRGQIISLHVGLTQWKPIFSLEIFGSQGYCLVEGLGRKYGGKETLTIGTLVKGGKARERTVVCNPEPANALRAELAEFLSAIRRRSNAASTGQDALLVLETVKKAYAASNK